MTKREFLKTIAAAAMAAGTPAAAWASGQTTTARRTKKNFVWMTPNLRMSTDDITKSFALMKASGISGIMAEIYNGTNAFYRSRKFPVKAEWLEAILPLAAAHGLEVHAWMWTMPCLQTDVISDHPDWYNVNARGESAVDKPAYVSYYKFLDPARPEVREYVRGTVQELAAIKGLAGVHLDYVRYPDAILPSGLWTKYGIVQDRVYPPYDYGYTEYSRHAFKTKFGVDPLELDDPESNHDWLQYRLDAVVDMVNEYLVPAAHAGGKVITAAVFPGPSRARTMVRQDWGRFKLDAFLPMLYQTFYEAGPEFVKTYTEEAVRTVKQPVYSGLFVSPLSADDFTRTIDMALAGGATGVSIFDYGAMTPERWQLLAKAIAR
jgi:uncharacterized lipoprotein YddW (UPF0748 family)